MSKLGPWQFENGRHVRRDEQRRLGAATFVPGDADDGRWGWFAMAPSGNSDGGKVSSETEAMLRADEALERLEGAR